MPPCYRHLSLDPNSWLFKILYVWKSHVDLSFVNLLACSEICPIGRIFTWYSCLPFFELSRTPAHCLPSHIHKTPLPPGFSFHHKGPLHQKPFPVWKWASPRIFDKGDLAPQKLQKLLQDLKKVTPCHSALFCLLCDFRKSQKIASFWRNLGPRHRIWKDQPLRNPGSVPVVTPNICLHTKKPITFLVFCDDSHPKAEYPARNCKQSSGCTGCLLRGVPLEKVRPGLTAHRCISTSLLRKKMFKLMRWTAAQRYGFKQSF